MLTLPYKKTSFYISHMFSKIANMFGLEVYKKRAGYHYVPDIYGKSSHKTVDIRSDSVFMALASQVISSNKTYLYYDRLYTLYECLKNVISIFDKERINIAEVGVFRGGGSYFLAMVGKKFSSKSFWLFSIDTFEGISDKDIHDGTDGLHVAGSFSDTSYEAVKEYLSAFKNITVIQGRIQESTSYLNDLYFHLIHLDTDLYDPTLFSLKYFDSKVPLGGIIIIDDYGFSSCPGIEKAVKEFRAKYRNYVGIQLMTGQYILIKIGNFTLGPLVQSTG